MPQPGAVQVINPRQGGGGGVQQPNVGAISQGGTQGLAMLLQALGQVNQQQGEAQAQGRNIQAQKELSAQQSAQRKSEVAAEQQGQQGIDAARIGAQRDANIAQADAMNPMSQAARQMPSWIKLMSSPDLQTFQELLQQARLQQVGRNAEVASATLDAQNALATKQARHQDAVDQQSAYKNMEMAIAHALVLENRSKSLAELAQQDAKMADHLEGMHSALTTSSNLSLAAGRAAASALIAGVHAGTTPAEPPMTPEQAKSQAYAVVPSIQRESPTPKPALTGELSPLSKAALAGGKVNIGKDATGAPTLSGPNGESLATRPMDASQLLGALDAKEFSPYEMTLRTSLSSQFPAHQVEQVMGLLTIAATGKPPMVNGAPTTMDAWAKSVGLTNGDAYLNPKAILIGLKSELDANQTRGRGVDLSQQVKETAAEQGSRLPTQSATPLPEDKYRALSGMFARAYSQIDPIVSPTAVELAATKQRLGAFRDAVAESAGDTTAAQKSYLRLLMANSLPTLVRDVADNGTPESRNLLNQLRTYMPQTFDRIKAEVESQDFLLRGGKEGLVDREMAAANQEYGTIASKASAKARETGLTEPVVDAAKTIGGKPDLESSYHPLSPDQVGPSPLTTGEFGQAQSLLKSAAKMESDTLRTRVTPEQPVSSGVSWDGVLRRMAGELGLTTPVGRPQPVDADPTKHVMDNSTSLGLYNLAEDRKRMQGAIGVPPSGPQNPGNAQTSGVPQAPPVPMVQQPPQQDAGMFAGLPDFGSPTQPQGAPQ